MGHSVTPIINRDNRKNKSGLYKIQIRVTLDSKSKYFSLDEKVALKYWSGKPNKWVKESHPHNFQINKLISDKVNSIEAHVYKLKNFGYSVNLTAIEEFWNRRGNKNLLNDYIENYLRETKFNSLNTVKKYKTLQKHMNNFDARIYMTNVNEEFLQRLGKYLLSLGHTGSTALKYMDPLRKICKNAVKKGYLLRDPFYEAELGIEKSKPQRTYLEIEEILTLKNLEIPPDRMDLIKVNTHFLFCFYAGCYYSDLGKLVWSEIKNSDLGYVIVGTRFKNNQLFVAPIHRFSHAVEIIESQRGLNPEFVFPELISEQKFNEKLKELASIAHIDKRLTNKVARHSNIQFWESQGLETQFTSKMAGHTDERTTKEYFDFSVRDINTRVGRFDLSKLGL